MIEGEGESGVGGELLEHVLLANVLTNESDVWMPALAVCGFGFGVAGFEAGSVKGGNGVDMVAMLKRRLDWLIKAVGVLGGCR